MDPTTNTDTTNNTNPEVRLVDVQIIDENTALNVIVSFLSLAQKRGSFTFDESAKIWECIQLFQKPKNL
jgi:hypothetical protein